jgi:hypothetical protein
MRREGASSLVAIALSVLASRCMLGGEDLDGLQPWGPQGSSGFGGGAMSRGCGSVTPAFPVVCRDAEEISLHNLSYAK